MSKPKGPRAERRLHDGAWIQSQAAAFAKDIAAQGVLGHALLVGIERRGAALARRVREAVAELTKVRVPCGSLDITLYRDDVALRGPKLHTPKGGTRLEGPLDDRLVFLIDDVLCTGRTIRAALSELMDFGRPGMVRLYSLIDRGGRELPIQPDRVGERLTVSTTELVDVRLKEVDGEDGVYVLAGEIR
jgi:pyrimidine operon attenuation protein/uracil phosphoribosyltransferase